MGESYRGIPARLRCYFPDSGMQSLQDSCAGDVVRNSHLSAEAKIMNNSDLLVYDCEACQAGMHDVCSRNGCNCCDWCAATECKHRPKKDSNYCKNHDGIKLSSPDMCRRGCGMPLKMCRCNDKQPMPKGKGELVGPLVISDIEARNALGEAKYGEKLTTHNGRSAIDDAYSEALDLAQYLKQASLERRDYSGLVDLAVELYYDFEARYHPSAGRLKEALAKIGVVVGYPNGVGAPDIRHSAMGNSGVGRLGGCIPSHPENYWCRNCFPNRPNTSGAEAP